MPAAPSEQECDGSCCTAGCARLLSLQPLEPLHRTLLTFWSDAYSITKVIFLRRNGEWLLDACGFRFARWRVLETMVMVVGWWECAYCTLRCVHKMQSGEFCVHFTFKNQLFKTITLLSFLCAAGRGFPDWQETGFSHTFPTSVPSQS